jgi:hypothetical protein
MNRLGFSKIRLTWVAPSGQLHPSANHLEGFFEALFRTITLPQKGSFNRLHRLAVDVARCHKLFLLR